MKGALVSVGAIYMVIIALLVLVVVVGRFPRLIPVLAVGVLGAAGISISWLGLGNIAAVIAASIAALAIIMMSLVALERHQHPEPSELTVQD